MQFIAAMGPLSHLLHPGRVLVVEDDPVVRQVVRRALETAGYEVHEASDGVRALEELEASDPDLVLLDLIMPRMSGVEMLQVLRGGNTRWAGLPVVVLTGNKMDTPDLAAADAVLYKPFDPLDVQAAILLAIARRRERTRHPAPGAM